MTLRKLRVSCAYSLICSALIAVPSIALDIPAKLTPPADTGVIGAYTAKGVQIYVCAVHGAVTEWTFKAPEAQLVDAKGAAFAKHYAGPTWEAADGSKITGKVLETAPAPTAGAIPWLLLSAEPVGQGVLASARFVQRVNTAGGVGPTGGCPAAGTEQRVPYTAEYIIYR
jgi:hypothetical protein